MAGPYRRTPADDPYSRSAREMTRRAALPTIMMAATGCRTASLRLR